MKNGFVELSDYADTVTGWHLENDHLLHPTNPEAVITETRQIVAKLDQSIGIMVSQSFAPFVAKL